MEDKDIKIVEEFIRWLKIDFEYNSGNEIKAIENLLSRLKTAERMNDVLAEEMALHSICSGVEESDKCYANEIQCGKCIKEWARKKVEDER